MVPWRRHPLVFALCAAPPIFWLIGLFLAPVAGIAILSFGENRGVLEIAVTGVPDNVIRALDPLYLRIFLRSLILVGLATAACFVIGMPLAIGVAFAPRRLRHVLLLLIVLPFWTNLLIRTYALIAALRTRGHVNATLEWLHERLHAGFDGLGLGFAAGALLGERFEPLPLLYNDFAVFFGLVYIHLPFTVLPLYAALSGFNRSYLEAAVDLGDSHLGAFRRIVLPLIRPGVYSAGLLTFAPALGSFLIPDLLGGVDSQVIANVIERQFKSANDWPFGAALSTLLMALTFVAVALHARMSAAAEKAGAEHAGRQG